MVYQDIIQISNDTRSILETSHKAHLTAINAALAARRAGNVKGFEAVAGELKSFSLKLAAAMQDMSSYILAVSQSVSNLFRQRHSLRNHGSAYTLSQAKGHISVLAQAEARQRGLTASLLDRVRKLAFHVISALRLCRTGKNLARAAMVEAAYGGEATGMLRTVANDIESTVDTIYERLKAIYQRIKEQH